jgi:hypothetical protein
MYRLPMKNRRRENEGQMKGDQALVSVVRHRDWTSEPGTYLEHPQPGAVGLSVLFLINFVSAKFA